MPHQNLGSIAFFLTQVNTVSIWAPWKINIFDGAQTLYRVTIFFGPHVANFLAKVPSNFFQYPCFTCYRTATWNLHLFCNTLLHPSMWITLVYPSLHISEFTSPSSTVICHLAFVHPPWASSVFFGCFLLMCFQYALSTRLCSILFFNSFPMLSLLLHQYKGPNHWA